MNTITLFKMQKALDQHIESQHKLEHEDLFDRKVLALLVEIGELANETRCFKFWSVKPPSQTEIILEEFVDGVHFILSLGIECGFESLESITQNGSEETDTSKQFLSIYKSVHKFRNSRRKEDYEQLFQGYLKLAQMLGLNEDQIEQAYIKKNEVNYERQRKGY
ncbi:MULTISPECIES: dUTP diphosphatase [unclassified Bacillus (in: firmicutes)]|uniref:dUTP diphosphatase n=1 Tax=unclassified Bacillus (in: firmicutes) TaxID=185979 RepID=UPI001BEBF1E7|nr:MULTISPECIES: dUTP diphosphatase [unclassified Bacillus (in: firmicutes)]MBT2638536.1 dUTP diphosphatase [Bacillus sp. ISL-39]MBT2660542.1 dUTP diphosphatase [Bacillus sp. ISL-45]